MSTSSTPLVYIDEATVGELITWPLVIQAVDQALQSVVEDEGKTHDLPNSVQKARTATIVPDGSGKTGRFITRLGYYISHSVTGLLFTMPGYIGNYQPLLATTNSTTTNNQSPPNRNMRSNTLGCKLVTSFKDNGKRKPPLPTIAATIVLFDSVTGSLAAVLSGTQITTWRTAAASLVATRALWFERHRHNAAALKRPRLAIVGCGVEGRAHAIGMASTFPLGAITLWNRTTSRARLLHSDLERMRNENRFADSTTHNASLSVRTADTVADCVRDADIIVVATYASEPLIELDMLRPAAGAGVHINAVGAGPGNHHSELSDALYAEAHIFVDSIVSARVELATLQHPIQGQVGEVVAGIRTQPQAAALTVFQSMGEDNVNLYV